MFARALPGASSPIRKPQEKFGKGGEKEEEEERFIHFFLKILSPKPICFNYSLLLLLLLLLNNSSTKANGRDHGRSLDAERGERQQRHRKIRSRLTGTADRPRISVYRSNQHVFVQVIDDDAQKTLVSLGTQSQEVKAVVGSEEWKTKTVAAASELGKMLGKKCVDAGITSAVFDRGGFLYHGRVKAVADGCREAGVAI